MNINTNDLNFKGRYLLRGKCEQVNRAMGTIKQAKGNKVEFLPITCGNNKIAIVATNDDAILLSNAKKQEDLQENIKKLCAGKKGFLPKLFKMIFGIEKDAIIIQDENLARFALPTNTINYDNGISSSKYKSAEHFVDGTIKKYTLKGRLYEIIRPNGSKEEIGIDGSRKITHLDGSVEIISSATSKQERKRAFDEIKEAESKIQDSAIIKFTPKESTPVETQNISNAKAEEIKPQIMPTLIAEIQEAPKTPAKQELQAVKFVSSQPESEPEININEVYDKKGRLTKKYLEDGREANYHYNGNTDELLFIYYSDGKYESEKGIPNYHSGTICFPYKDEIKQILDCEGRLVSFIFPDGIRKNFDKQGNITEKIYPSRKKELFNEEGRMYCIVHPNGEKEYIRKRPNGTFSA